jgi:hypothetical protein
MSQIIKPLTSSGPIPGNIATLYTEDIGTATPANNNLNVNGGAGIQTVGSGDSILISTVTGGFRWIETSISMSITGQVGVFCNAALTISLPLGTIIGITDIIYVDTTGNVIIQAPTGQKIQIGNEISEASGTANTSVQGSMVQLVFKLSDLTWHATAVTGAWTVT